MMPGHSPNCPFLADADRRFAAATGRFERLVAGTAERVLGTLITGMERDLERFPNPGPGDPPPVPAALC